MHQQQCRRSRFSSGNPVPRVKVHSQPKILATSLIIKQADALQWDYMQTTHRTMTYKFKGHLKIAPWRSMLPNVRFQVELYENSYR